MSEPEETYFRSDLPPLSPEAEEAYQNLRRRCKVDWDSVPATLGVQLAPSAVACPARTCGAAVGDPCVTSTGATRAELHGLRWLALFPGPLVRCAAGTCGDCWYTGWVPGAS